jgi:hypothetical protein
MRRATSRARTSKRVPEPDSSRCRTPNPEFDAVSKILRKM